MRHIIPPAPVATDPSTARRGVRTGVRAGMTSTQGPFEPYCPRVAAPQPLGTSVQQPY